MTWGGGKERKRGKEDRLKNRNTKVLEACLEIEDLYKGHGLGFWLVRSKAVVLSETFPINQQETG